MGICTSYGFILMRLFTLFVVSLNAFAAFTYNRSVTIDHTVVSGSNSNFPVLISGTYSYLATVANGGKVQNSNGYDIGFYTNSDCSTGKMAWETGLYTATTGAVIYWINVSSVNSTSDTVFYMCYGDSGVSTDQSNKTSVWDANYKGVWHFPNGSTLGALDSTSNADNGTITGATATTGPTYLDGASAFADNTQKILVAGRTFNNTQAATISCWFKVTSHTGYRTIVGGGSTGGALGLRVGTDAKIHSTKSGYADFAASTGTITDGVWTYLVYSVDNAGNFIYYLNGSSSGTGSYTSNPAEATTGLGYSSGLNESLTGSLDEVRFSFVQRSASWIATEYANQNSPSTFYALGAESGGSTGTYKRTRIIVQ